ncbi:MAG: molybdopterin dinucleotide binding domain-containing protein, partial [Polaromonas sp.]|nr:molybdopterin dinucleotide binding domain-containing protein [Polaromonas sp.]
LILPATTWGEKSGTVTNSERSISRVRAAVDAPGETRHDWSIAVDFAQRLEKLLPAPAVRGLFNYAGTEAIWNEHRESTRGRDLDITGMSYAMLDDAPQQWPLREGETTGKTRLYEDAIFPTDDGRARFVNTLYKPVAEPRESRYPFSLTTGRLRDQWHGMSRTGTLGRLFGHVAEPSIQMNAQDMARRLLKDGDLVQVTSKRGSIVVPLQASAELQPSQAFMAMHWGDDYLSGLSSSGTRLAGVNALTTSAYCPSSKQPELKHAAVKILKAELPWSLLAMAWLPNDKALAARELLKPLMASFAFSSSVPFSNEVPLAQAGRQRTGVLFRAAAFEAPPEGLLEKIEAILGLDGADALRYADRKKGQHRTMRLVRQQDQAQLAGFVLAGDASAEAWIRTLLQDELPAQSYGRLLLLPGARAPGTLQTRGKPVCTCFSVTDAEIAGVLDQMAQAPGNAGLLASEEDRLAVLQDQLKCGTNCGSCVPEIKRIIRSHSVTSAPASPASDGRKVIPIKVIA